jgi:hypothetical protein
MTSVNRNMLRIHKMSQAISPTVTTHCATVLLVEISPKRLRLGRMGCAKEVLGHVQEVLDRDAIGNKHSNSAKITIHNLIDEDSDYRGRDLWKTFPSANRLCLGAQGRAHVPRPKDRLMGPPPNAG